jgi:N-acetylmuramoyl-L-alanine amidase
MRSLRALLQCIQSRFQSEPTLDPMAEVEAHITQAEAPAPRLSLFEGRLEGDRVSYCPSPNSPGLFAHPPEAILIHYTASLTAKSAIDRLTSSDKPRVSAHLVIDRDATIYQLLRFDAIGWHAGVSQWQGRQGLNTSSIGIELVNAGRLEKRGDEYYAWSGQRVDDSAVLGATHRHEDFSSYWQLYTPEQIGMCKTVCSLLCQHYPIADILGHEEVSPGRKMDPGPAFPLDTLRNDLGPF